MKVTRNIDTGDEKQTIRTISTKPKEHFEGRWKSGRLYPLYSVVVNNGTTFISQNAKMKEEPYVIYDADKKEFKAPDGWLIKEMSADSRVTALGGGGEGGVTPEEVEEMIKDKVDKVEGKGLSTNDYDNTEKNKVASAYQKPNNGIPKSDLAKAVQDVLDNADGAYKKPVTGIPFTDLADGVQDSLSNADEAKAGLAGKQDTISDLSAIRSGAAAGATSVQPAEFNELKDEVDTIGNGAYEEAWDGDSTPVVADIPEGVVVTYSSASYTGTLAASASTVDKIYLVSDGNGNYDRYTTVEANGAYSWKKVGSTKIVLSDYATRAEVSQLEAEVGDIDERTANLDADEEDALFVVDSDSNIVAKIDKDGISTTALRTKQVDPFFYDEKIFVTDGKGNVILSVGADGLKVTKVGADNILPNDWLGKVVATYGDSVTAVNNGDFEPPYVITQNNWGNRVADYYKFGKQYGRGIGSTCFMWRGTSGGQIAWCKTTTGEYVDRNDSYNYDNYEGNVTIPSGCTAVRGDGCSWLRIVTMFPASIKSTIDAVLVMFHNDYHQDMDTAVEWVENSQTDPEWAASDEYETLGGDYNIGTVQGGIASVVMKLQAWMPQARIILMTPISGVYATEEGIDGDFDNAQSALMHKLATVVKDIASRMSIPVIDNFSNDGINSLNRSEYIYDKIHPYTAKGSKALAASVIGQMKTILPAL